MFAPVSLTDVKLSSVDLSDPLWWLTDIREEDSARIRPLVLAVARYHQALGRSLKAIRTFIEKPTFYFHLDRVATCFTCGLEMPGWDKSPEVHGEYTEHRTFTMREIWPWQPKPPAVERRVKLVLT